MIIPHGNNPNPVAQPIIGRAIDDAAKVHNGSANIEAARGAAIEMIGAKPDPRPPSSEQLKEAVKDINRAMQQSHRNLEFSVDADTDRLIVRLTDTETGELIRQIPSDETLAISRAIGEFQNGLLLKQEA